MRNPFKNTPGPWRIEQGVYLSSYSGRNIAHIFQHALTDNEQSDADARLIAATPDMLDALIIANDYIAKTKNCPERVFPYAMTAKAITKAVEHITNPNHQETLAKWRGE